MRMKQVSNKSPCKNVGDAVLAMSRFVRLMARVKSKVPFRGKKMTHLMLTMPPDRGTISYEKQLGTQQARVSRISKLAY